MQLKIAHVKSCFIATLLSLFHEIQGQKVKLKVAKLNNGLLLELQHFSLHADASLLTLFTQLACSLKRPIQVTTLWHLSSIAY